MVVEITLAVSSVVLLAGLVRGVDGSLVSPIGLLLLRHLALFVVFFAFPVAYDSVSLGTWAVLIAALFASTIGWFVLARGRRLPSWRFGVVEQSDRVARDLRIVWIAAALTITLFLVYCSWLQINFGLGSIVSAPTAVRVAISAGGAPPGFQFIYLAEVLPALAVSLVVRAPSLSPGQRQWLWAVAGFCVLALYTTTARTNMVKAILWVAAVLLLTRGRRRIGAVNWVRIAGLAAAVVALFTLVGDNIGKSFENSALRAEEVSSAWKPVALPVHYQVAAIPTLDKLRSDETLPTGYGVYSLNPAAKVLSAVVPGLSAPSHIGEFYNSPYPFNVATGWDVFYKDFRDPGIVAGAFALGAGLAAVWRTAGRRSGSVFAPVLGSWALLVAFSMPNAAAFGKVSYVFQLAVLLYLTRGSTLPASGSQGPDLRPGHRLGQRS